MTERPILFSAPMVQAILAGRKTQTRRVIKPQPFIDPMGNVAVPNKRGDVSLYGQHPDGSPQWQNFARWRAPCQPGDTLWVREAVWIREWESFGRPKREVIYRATDEEAASKVYKGIRWRPSIHMPRWASRITLRCTDVRVERLNECSEADAIAEGLYRSKPDQDDLDWFRDHTLDREGREPSEEEWAQFKEGVWMAPGVPQGWGMTRAERQRDQWGPTAQFAYRLVWDHINGKTKGAAWADNPLVWVISFTPEDGSQNHFASSSAVAKPERAGPPSDAGTALSLASSVEGEGRCSVSQRARPSACAPAGAETSGGGDG